MPSASQQHLASLGVTRGDPALEVGPGAGVDLARAVRRLPAVVDDDRAGFDLVGREPFEQFVVNILAGVRGRGAAGEEALILGFRTGVGGRVGVTVQVVDGARALGAPAAEDGLAPPGRGVLSCGRGGEAVSDEVVAILVEHAPAGFCGAQHEARRHPLSADLRVRLVVQPHEEPAVERGVAHRGESELVDGGTQPHPEPVAARNVCRALRAFAGKAEGERRGREDGVEAAGIRIADDSQGRGSFGVPHERDRLGRRGDQEAAEPDVGAELAARRVRHRAPPAEQRDT
jgi:hypothetical protein